MTQKKNPVCKICGEELGLQYTTRGEEVWNCFNLKCQERLKKEKVEALIKEKKEYPERFLSGYNVPKKHLSKSLDNFKGNSKIVKICKTYSLKAVNSLLLIGPCGSGKTHLAVSILKEMIRNNLVGKEWSSEAKIKGAYFITTPELLLEIRQSFQDSADTNESEMIEYYATMPFLILDDLGAEKVSEWAVTTLYLIIDRRNREEKPTIFTTNLSLVEIEQQLSVRIASRLADCRVIQLDMPDYRKKR